MNIEIANRLVTLRKRNSLSQEALAEKLGISRQAVSKWERAEASPDTDNLILLSRIYGISMDELLSTEDEIPVSYMDMEEEKLPEGLPKLTAELSKEIGFFLQKYEGINPEQVKEMRYERFRKIGNLQL